MDGIRLKITPTLKEDGKVHLLMEWVEVKDNAVIGVLASEEFALAPERAGCAYVSRATFQDGMLMPGTFWLDEQGLRHFILQAQAGAIGLTGQSTL